MTAADHLRRYPNARPSTIAYLVEREKKNDQLRREVRQMRPEPRPRPWWAFWRAA